ncbi:MAG: alpha/beta fold hydrolase [Candidatus Hodarchaeales archaeon]|jgi:pimeloyl-ACP methyl ester carboxylesterase
MVKKFDFDYFPSTFRNAPNLLFVHGAGGDKTQWQEQKTFFQDLGWGVVILSLPGHGQSVSSGSLSISKCVDEISLLIISLGLEQVSLIGHSMGGAIALQLALQNDKSQIKVLVLVGTGANMYVNPNIFELLETDFNQALQLITNFAYGENALANLKQKNETVMRNIGFKTLYEAFKACSLFDVREEINKIAIPTLIICGENDKMMPVKYSLYLNKNIDQSKLVTIPQMGHFVFQESSNQVNKQIYDFISSSLSF